MAKAFNGLPTINQDERIRFLRERDTAILSFDRKKIEAYSCKYNVPLPDNDKVFWMGICKAVLALQSASVPEKRRAEKRLNDLRENSEEWAKQFN